MNLAVLAPLLLATSLAASPNDSSALAPPPPEPARLVAAAWCPVLTDKPKAERPGCDMGIGVAIRCSRRFPSLCLSGTGGAKTIGGGLSYTFGHIGERPLAIAIGPFAPYDKDGIHVDRWALGIGGTFGFKTKQ